MITDMTSTTLKAMAMEDSMPKLTLIKYFKPFSVGVGVDLECMGHLFILEDPGVPGAAEEVACPGVVNFSNLVNYQILVLTTLITLKNRKNLVENICPKFLVPSHNYSISCYVTHPDLKENLCRETNLLEKEKKYTQPPITFTHVSL